MQIIKQKSKNLTILSATAKLNEYLKKVIDAPVLLLLSGGSALDLLETIDSENLGHETTIAALDERFTMDPLENNFAQIAGTDFYRKAADMGSRFIDTRVKNMQTMNQLRDEYNSKINKWINENRNGKIVATIGIGHDGHISGMLPFPENSNTFRELFDNGKEGEYVVAYDATGKNKFNQRVTTNMNMLRKIDIAIVYVVGESKRDALKDVQAESGSLAVTPARILNEMRGQVFLYTDL